MRVNRARPKKLVTRTRDEIAWQLRLEGKSYEAIGRKMGVTAMGAHGMVMRVLDQHETHLAEQVPQMRKQELDRCDMYLDQLMKGCRKGNIGSIQTALKVAERRARLAGVDLPIKIDPLAGEGGQMAVDLFRKMLDDATTAATKALEPDEEEKA